MGDNNEEVSLTDFVVAQPTAAEHNELVMQLMQQIAEIRVEMQQKHDPPPPGFASNAVDGRPTKRELDETMNSINLYFSSQNEQI